jgi:hypothetical protein
MDTVIEFAGQYAGQDVALTSATASTLNEEKKERQMGHSTLHREKNGNVPFYQSLLYIKK